MLELRYMFIICCDTECWDIVIDLNRGGYCGVLWIRVVCQSERISTGYCDMMEQQFLYQITRRVMELDDYRTIGIMNWL